MLRTSDTARLLSNEHGYAWTCRLLLLLPRAQWGGAPQHKEMEDGVNIWSWKQFSSREASLADPEELPKRLRWAMLAAAVKEYIRHTFQRAVSVWSDSKNLCCQWECSSHTPKRCQRFCHCDCGCTAGHRWGNSVEGKTCSNNTLLLQNYVRIWNSFHKQRVGQGVIQGNCTG